MLLNEIRYPALISFSGTKMYGTYGQISETPPFNFGKL